MSRTSSGLARLLGSPWAWLAVGMIVRIFHVATLGNRYYFGDTSEYEIAALRLLHSGSLEGNSVRAPAYPAVLALSFWLGGEQNYVAARVIQLAISLVHMLLGVWLATRIGGRAAGVVAAPALALAPPFVFVAGLLYPTLLYSTVVLAMTCVAWDLAERPRTSRAVLLGVLIAIGWLTDMVILAPTCAVLGWLVFAARRQPAALARTLGIAGLVAAMLTVPFLGQVAGGMKSRAFMSKAQAVLHFARTDTLISRGRWIRMPFGTPFAALPPREFAARELGLMRAEPVKYTHDYMFELVHFFQPIPDRVTTKNRFNTKVILWVGGVWFSLVLSLSILGFVRGDASWRGRLLLAAVVFATAAFYALFFTQTRYRIPVEPEMVVLGAFGVAYLFPHLTRLLGDAAAPPGRGPVG